MGPYGRQYPRGRIPEEGSGDLKVGGCNDLSNRTLLTKFQWTVSLLVHSIGQPWLTWDHMGGSVLGSDPRGGSQWLEIHRVSFSNHENSTVKVSGGYLIPNPFCSTAIFNMGPYGKNTKVPLSRERKELETSNIAIFPICMDVSIKNQMARPQLLPVQRL